VSARFDATAGLRQTGDVDTDGEFETGYGPETAAGDNVLHDYAAGEARSFVALAVARGDRVVRHDELGLTCTDRRSPTPFGNAALVERPLSERQWDDAVACMREFFAPPGGAFLVFSPFPTPDLGPRGFDRVGHPPLMWRAPGGPLPAPPAGLEVREVTDAATAAAYETALVHGYPIPELEPVTAGCLLPPDALGASGWRHWVGYLDGRPVGTSSAWVDDSLVHVTFVAALTECRGRGIGAAMTAVATAHDHLPAALVASDLGRPVYERMGYVALLRYTLWAGRRGA
jgi:hypothetical protein